jgi:hypothetical protein
MKIHPYLTFSHNFDITINSNPENVIRKIQYFLTHDRNTFGRVRANEFAFMNRRFFPRMYRFSLFIFSGNFVMNNGETILRTKSRLSSPIYYFLIIFLIIWPISVFFIPKDDFIFPLNFISRILIGLIVDFAYYIGLVISYISKIYDVKDILKQVKIAIEKTTRPPEKATP